MSFFGALVRTTVNVGLLPIAVAQDALTLGGTLDDNGQPHTMDALQRLKDEADAS